MSDTPMSEFRALRADRGDGSSNRSFNSRDSFFIAASSRSAADRSFTRRRQTSFTGRRERV